MPVWRSHQPPQEATNPNPWRLSLARIPLGFRLSLRPLFATALSPLRHPSRAVSAYRPCHHLACDSRAFCGQIVALQQPHVALQPTPIKALASGNPWQVAVIVSFSTGFSTPMTLRARRPAHKSH
jgi:hypothetical protein